MVFYQELDKDHVSYISFLNGQIFQREIANSAFGREELVSLPENVSAEILRIWGDTPTVEETEEDALNKAKKQKQEEISAQCQQTIFSGIDIYLSSGKEHFRLKTEDQINLFGLKDKLSGDLQEIEYHADGKPCVYYSKEEMIAIIEKATQFIAYHTTYCNSFYTWINALASKEAVKALSYGDEIPEEYQSEVLKNYLKAGKML